MYVKQCVHALCMCMYVRVFVCVYVCKAMHMHTLCVYIYMYIDVKQCMHAVFVFSVCLRMNVYTFQKYVKEKEKQIIIQQGKKKRSKFCKYNCNL